MNFEVLFKPGVTRRGAFADRALRMERQHKGWWPFSYALLEDLAADFDSARDEPLLERLYQSQEAGNGIYKITRRGRFTDLDEQLVNDCRSRFSGDQPLRIHDAGCSSGISSLELFELFSRERTVELLATDAFDQITLVSLPGGRWVVSFDAQQRPLQLASRWFVLSARRQSPWRYLVNRLVQTVYQYGVLDRAEKMLQQHVRGGFPDGVRDVSLFHPLVIQRSREKPNFQARRHDIFRPYFPQQHVVRVMNLLTPHHFAAEQVRQGIRACMESLLPGGLLVVGRSIDEEDGRNCVTAYELRQGRLEEVWRLNEGCEIDYAPGAISIHSLSVPK